MKFRVRTSKFAPLMLGTLVIIVSLGVFNSIAIAQSPDGLKQATSPPDSSNSSSGVEVIEYAIPYSERQTFSAIMAEANAAARNLINQSFRANPSTNQVSLTITGSRHGDIVPLLMLRVSREDWQASPRVEEWARNLGSSAMRLLAYGSGYDGASRSSRSAAGRSSNNRPFVPVPPAAGSRQQYVIPGASLEESDPGYR